MIDCPCWHEPGYWWAATNLVSEEQRQEARDYVECVRIYHLKGKTIDHQFRANLYMGRLAETSAARILGMEAATCQSEGPLRYQPDLVLPGAPGIMGARGAGVRWTGLRTPVLFFKSPSYERRDDGRIDRARMMKRQPLEEPEILAVGDDQEISLLGWLRMVEVSPTYSTESPFFSVRFDNWAVPVESLHRLPLYEHHPRKHNLVDLRRSQAPPAPVVEARSLGL